MNKPAPMVMAASALIMVYVLLWNKRMWIVG